MSDQTERPTQPAERSIEQAEQRTGTATIAEAELPTEENRVHAPGEDSGPAGREQALPAAASRDVDGEEPAPLFNDDASGRYQSRWQEIQTDFVDDPQRAVQRADGLVAELMQELARTFSEERAGLEGRWDKGRDVSTEELRVALQRYRSFFTRLLTL